MTTNPDKRKQNLRLGWILATIALAFFIGFVVRIAFFGA
ncbi:MAG TPA: cytochrome oxidase small assembly protein [Burkholderiaceae bacterium]|nr:cytochrome oxidase small assembly protein [Burkholderiaceae bacterium]